MPAWVLLVSTVAFGALGRGIDRDHDDAGRLGSFDRRLDGLRIAGVEQDQIDAGGDEIIDLGILLAQIVVEADRRDLHIGIGLFRLELRSFRQRDEERIAHRAERDADRLEFFGRGDVGADHQRSAGEQDFLEHAFPSPPGALLETRAPACPGSADAQDV